MTNLIGLVIVIFLCVEADRFIRLMLRSIDKDLEGNKENEKV